MKFKFPVKKKEAPIDRVAALEARIFSAKKETGRYSIFDNMLYSWYSGSPKTLEDQIESNFKDFEELDRKFDALERFLEIEYYKEDTETQTYDWADKKHAEGFRKAPKKYEAMKAEKEAEKKEKEKNEHYCD